MPVCAECGRDNSEGARFCNGCGALLDANGGAEVRKIVTVLFCDLVGSTSLGDRSDPEVLRELMGRYHRELRAILERHGGLVEKFIGDAAMAVFGIPQVHEDDALRATRAAVEMREAVGRLGLEVRIGVNTGEVVAGQGETLVTGDAVNVAARLEQAASPGEVLLGEETHALVREFVRTEPAGPLALKGKPEPVPAHRLLALLPSIPVFGRPIGAPFVGRVQDLATLERALSRAFDERSAQLVTIVGPPGIGKSRLARELIQRSQAHVVAGGCLSYGEGITYWPLAEIVGQLGDMKVIFPADEDGKLAASRIAAAVGTAQAVSSDEIAWGFRKLFEALAREQPLIVVLDDIHWAEPTLLDLIEYVSTFTQDVPLLLLCMARPDLLDHRPAWATPRPNATLVTLEPLAPGETETLIEELHQIPDAARVRIVEAAQGNPLFVEQLLAMQADSANGELMIPPTIQALLSARIDGLGAEERAVLERASVEGVTFHRGTVQELLPAGARAAAGGHLMALARKGFIRADRAQLPGDDGFRFGHILMRDAAYDLLPKRSRAELHERVAAWLASRLGAEAPDEILGFHLERAFRYWAELGQDDQHMRTLGLRAARYLAQAGRRADARADAGATCSLLRRATELLPENDPDLPVLLARLGSATYEAGDAPRALETLGRAKAAAAAAGMRSVELRARMDELAIRVTADPQQRTDEALAEIEAAIAELQPLNDAESLARAWRAVMQHGFLRGDNALVDRGSRGLLESARRAGIRREAVWAVRGLAAALTYGPAPVTEAIVQAEQGLAEYPDEGAGEDHLALIYAFAGRYEEAEQAIERSRRRFLELGQSIDHAWTSQDLAAIALLSGRPERAEPALRAAAEVLEKAGEAGGLSAVASFLAEVLYHLGRFDEADEWTTRAEQATVPEDVLGQAWWRAVRARILARRGQAEDALRVSAEATDLLRRTDDLPFIGDALAARAEVLLLLGRPKEARPVLQEALAVYERKGIVASAERARKALAELG
jgi:class 3 adenylate cyclase/tetratricopeptide (TPR) repeat protein